VHLHDKSSEACIKTRPTPAPLSSKGQATEQTTVKWSIRSRFYSRHATILSREVLRDDLKLHYRNSSIGQLYEHTTSFRISAGFVQGRPQK